MTDAADLVMPKLGLTMTEGRVAQWMVKPGENFAEGDTLVVIETDKIANDVEASAPGRLIEILVEEGAEVPVGTPIARWALEGTQQQRQTAPAEPEPRRPAEPVARVPVGQIATSPASQSGGQRIVATPFARRLARDAQLDLAGLTGSGPKGRIKAADVEKALERRRAPSPVAPAASSDVIPTRAAAPAQGAVRLSFATVDVDVDALQAIQTSLAKSGNGQFQLQHYVALACLRAFEPQSRDFVALGFDVPSAGSPRPVATETGRRESLSSLAARLASLEQVRTPAAEGGDIAIHVTEGALHHFGPAAPPGWTMALGVGSVRRVRGADAATHELSLALSYDANTVDHASAGRFLGGIKALLEEPLQLLAS